MNRKGGLFPLRNEQSNMFHIQMQQQQNKSKPSYLHPYVKLPANQLSWFVSEQTVQPVIH